MLTLQVLVVNQSMRSGVVIKLWKIVALMMAMCWSPLDQADTTTTRGSD